MCTCHPRGDNYGTELFVCLFNTRHFILMRPIYSRLNKRDKWILHFSWVVPDEIRLECCFSLVLYILVLLSMINVLCSFCFCLLCYPFLFCSGKLHWYHFMLFFYFVWVRLKSSFDIQILFEILGFKKINVKMDKDDRKKLFCCLLQKFRIFHSKLGQLYAGDKAVWKSLFKRIFKLAVKYFLWNKALPCQPDTVLYICKCLIFYFWNV